MADEKDLLEDDVEQADNESAEETASTNDAPPEPSEVDRLKAELRAEREARLSEVNQLKGILAGVSSYNTQAPASQVAVEDDDPTDEDFIQRPKESHRRLVQKELRQFAQNISPYIDALSDRQFIQEYRNTRADNAKVFDKLAPQINQYFTQNPNARRVPGEVDRVFKALVGENFNALLDEMSAEKLKETRFQRPSKGVPEKPAGPSYEDWELESMDRFGMTPEEWEDAKKSIEKPKPGPRRRR